MSTFKGRMKQRMLGYERKLLTLEKKKASAKALALQKLRIKLIRELVISEGWYEEGKGWL